MKNMKYKSYTIGIALLLIAASLILESLGALEFLTNFAGGISIPRMILGVILLYITIIDIRRRPMRTVWYLALLFMLFESNIAHLCGREDNNLINNWVVLLCALLIKIALHLLFGNHHCNWIWQWNGRDKFINGSNTVYIDCDSFEHKYVENNLGATDIHFTNIEQYAGGGTLKVENNLGQTNISVPAVWSLSMDNENNLGHIDAPCNNGTPGGPILHLNIENNLGHVSIRFV